MPTKDQLADHSWVIEQLKKAQDDDTDNREKAREAALFVAAPDGQWEPYVYESTDGKPRYTFDQVEPILDQILGEMGKNSFDVRITPAGGDASKDVAEIFEGLCRTIENISKSDRIYDAASKESVIRGLGGWRVLQRYVDDNSFDQDLVLQWIPNFIDRVWFGPHEEPDASDSQFAFVLSGVSKEEFEAEFPDASAASVQSDRSGNAYWHRTDQIMVGEFVYLVPQQRDLVLMSDGKVYEDDETFQTLLPALQQSGVEEVRRRRREKMCVYSRLFSPDEWLTEARETVFQNWVPVVPQYSNFDVIEDKVTYRGAVLKLMDPQRVLNYSMSREIEEGALAPRAKYWVTPTQAKGYEQTLATMNVNSDPVQFYNPDPAAPGAPQQNGGAQINPGLRTISEAMMDTLGKTAGMFAANMGDNPALQSGVAIEALQDRGDNGTNKFIRARELAQGHTARILVNAIPRVYTPGRQVRVLGEDRTAEMVTVGQEVIDPNTGQPIVLHDLSVGTYDVVCAAGPSFKSRQNETVKAITAIGQIDPTVIETAGDVLLANINAPGMDDVAARKRRQLLMAGVIPPEQMTEQEMQEMQAREAQGPAEDPNMVLAQAEQLKAQAEQAGVQLKGQMAQAEQMHKQAAMQLDGARFQFESQIKTQQLQLDAMKAQNERLKLQIELAQAQATIAKDQAAAQKTLAEAEEQDMKNDAVASGLDRLLRELQGT